MIISASRRTDIPAFYSDWFFKRIKDGYVLVRNPLNPHQVSKINLSKDSVDCIVFWTKNPQKMLQNLDLLFGYHYYFQFTLNSYDHAIEVNLPRKAELIKVFIELSNKIGKNKIIWRYDPILVTDKITIDDHYRHFDFLAAQLSNYTNKCLISFLDLYQKSQRNLKSVNLIGLTETDMVNIAANLMRITKKYGLKLETCAEAIELVDLGIKHGQCIDAGLIAAIIGGQINAVKDQNQRAACGCVTSIDIGSYNTCQNNCLYCYANSGPKTVAANVAKHDPNSPLLFGELSESDIITERKMVSCRLT